MEEENILDIECPDCNFVGKLAHSLELEKYHVEQCPFCGSQDIESEPEEF